MEGRNGLLAQRHRALSVASHQKDWNAAAGTISNGCFYYWQIGKQIRFFSKECFSCRVRMQSRGWWSFDLEFILAVIWRLNTNRWMSVAIIIEMNSPGIQLTNGEHWRRILNEKGGGNKEKSLFIYNGKCDSKTNASSFVSKLEPKSNIVCSKQNHCRKVGEKFTVCDAPNYWTNAILGQSHTKMVLDTWCDFIDHWAYILTN